MPLFSFEESYGLHRWQLLAGETVVAVSASTWKGFCDFLDTLSTKNLPNYIVSPELITIAGCDFSQVRSLEVVIERKIRFIRDLSKNYPSSVLLLGTPIFRKGFSKPFNGALAIKKGKIIGQTVKRTTAIAWERDFFEQNVEEQPFLLGNACVLICSDLPTAVWLKSARPTWDALKLAGKEYLHQKDFSAVHPRAEFVILLCCWGVGTAAKKLPGQTTANAYYSFQLQLFCSRFLSSFPWVKEIVVVDRAPLEACGIVASVPMNLYCAAD